MTKKNDDPHQNNEWMAEVANLQKNFLDLGCKSYRAFYGENAKSDDFDKLYEFWAKAGEPADFPLDFSLWQEAWQQQYNDTLKMFMPREWVNKINENTNEMMWLSPFHGGLGFHLEENTKLFMRFMEFAQYYQHRLQGDRAVDSPLATEFDKRFQGETWQESLPHDMLRHVYVMVSDWWHRSVLQNMENDATLNEKDKKRIEFNLKLLLGALSPSNFAFTNPEVIEEMLASKGQNLVKGMEHFLKDLVENKGQWRVTTVDHNAFDVGGNLARTEGEVIFSTPLFELIQYAPSREKELAEPILLVPPVINKYYVLDMQEHNSFVKWARDEGLSVFLMSWVNPDAELRDHGFNSYVMEIDRALLEMQKETNALKFHVLGYCVGGTMLSTYLARRAKTRSDIGIASATFLTSLINFKEVGDIGVFLNEDQMEFIEKSLQEKGYFDAYVMASSFSLLRANDLIWSFVVNNYLLGKDPPSFDLLYWNNDSTNLTERFFREYMDVAYIGNKLCKADAVTIDDLSIDMSKVTIPSCFVASEEDHIAPWRSCFDSARLFSCEKNFILSGSGHVNGMINPPYKNKYHYRSMRVGRYVNPDNWYRAAKIEKGSWWPCWRKFIGDHSSGWVDARKPAQYHKSHGKAPGSYVLKSC